jgi:hypothetical protein
MLERRHTGLLVSQALGGYTGRQDGTPLDNIRGTASFILPLDDVGDGTVNTTLARGTGSATFTRFTAATTRQWKPYYLSTGERVTLDLDFTRETLVPQVGSQTVTFTRSGTATRVNSAGLIETVAVDTPRYDYNPSTLAIKGLLIEEGRTNICLRSQEIGTAPWTIGNCIVTADDTISPAGTITGIRVMSNATGGSVGIAQSITATVSRYAFSFWIKAGNRASANYGIHNGATFEAQTSVIISGPGTVTGTGIQFIDGLSATEWTRVAVVTDNALAVASYGLFIYPFSAGESKGSYVYLWGAQFEAGAFATSYIPTTSSSVARGTDTVGIAALGSWFNPVEGSVAVEFIKNQLVGTGSGFSLDDGTASEFIRLGLPSNGFVNFQVTDGGVSQANFSIADVVDAGTMVRVSVAYKTNDFGLAADGTASAPDTAGTLPTVTALTIGRDTSSNNLNGHMRRFIYLPQRVSDVNLDTLSTSTPTLVSGSNLISVASGSPRSHYTPTGTYAGYLAEGARTNLCLQSEDVATTWTNTNSTEVVNAIVAPDGTITADRIIEDAVANLHDVRQNIVMAADTAHTISVFAKADQRTIIRLYADDSGANSAFAKFDVSAGTIQTAAAVSGTWATPSASVESWGNGWYRCTVSFTTTGAAGARYVLGICDATGAHNYSGDGANGIYIWGAQVEAGAFPSTYIPTTTIAVARNADVLSFPLANINQTEGAAFAEVSLSPDGRTTATGVFLAAASNGYPLYVGGVAVTSIQISDGNTANAIKNGLTSLTTGVRKRASTWGPSYKAVTGDGAAVGSVAAYFDQMGTTPNGFHIATSTSGDQPYGTVKNVRLWNRRLPDTILEQLTR